MRRLRYRRVMMTSVTATLAAAVVAIVPVVGSAQVPELDGFREYVVKAVEAWEAPGLAVAVIKDGATVFEAGFGVQELGADEAVDEHTLFSIGSTTKAMTAAAIAMLVDEGKLSWDDAVTDHLPWFRLSDPYVTSQIRIRDLLTHNVGLPNADFLWYEQDRGPREIVESLRYVEPAYSLRSGFIYQNIMYATAGQVIEAVTGGGWGEFVEARLFGPLGMDRSVSSLAATTNRSNVASPHYRIDGEIQVIENASVDPVAAAGSIWSSVHDMALWSGFLLAGGVTSTGERLISEASFEELFRPHAIVDEASFYPTARLTEPHWTTYALGWFQADYEGRAVDFHTGSIDGMVAIHGLLRDEGVGVYVLGNLDHVEVRHAIMYRVFDLYDPDPPRDWSSELHSLYDEVADGAASARARRDGSRILNTKSSLEPTDFAGTYADPLYGTVIVTAVDEGLRLQYGRRVGPLEHWHYDTFRVQWDTRWRGDALVQFVLGSDGAPARIDFQGGSFDRLANTPTNIGGRTR